MNPVFPSPLRCPAALLRMGLTALAGVAADLWTKSLAVSHLADGDDYQLWDGWLSFTYTRNHGAVFGLGQGYRGVFLIVSLLAVGVLVWLFAHSGRRRLYQIVLGLLMAGVIGNMYDRAVYGYVRDMIHALPRWPHLFPWIFNVADSMLCVGMGYMLIHSFFDSLQPVDAAAKRQSSVI